MHYQVVLPNISQYVHFASSPNWGRLALFFLFYGQPIGEVINHTLVLTRSTVVIGNSTPETPIIIYAIACLGWSRFSFILMRLAAKCIFVGNLLTDFSLGNKVLILMLLNVLMNKSIAVKFYFLCFGISRLLIGFSLWCCPF